MSDAKWRGVVGLAAVSDETTEAAPVIYPNCENANILGVPDVADGINSITREPIHQEAHGAKRSWEVSGIEPNADVFMYLAWALLGADTYTTEHALTYAALQQYLNVKVDDFLDKGTNQPTESLLGGKIGRFA